jgi:hypothetical protein
MQDEYEKYFADCKRNLHGRLSLNKLGDKPMIARDDLSTQLSTIWQTSSQWKILKNLCQ